MQELEAERSCLQLAQLAFLALDLGMAPPTVVCSLLHQLVMKKKPHR